MSADVLLMCAVSVGVSAFGIFIIFGAVRQIRRGMRCTSWPQVEGKILGTDIRRDNRGLYLPKVDYSYSVGDETFQSGVISFRDILWGSSQRAHEILAPFQISDDVLVFVKPNQPRVSCLVAERASSNTYLGLGMGGFFLLGGLYMLAFFLVNARMFK